MNTTSTDQQDLVREALIEAGFESRDALDDPTDDLLTERESRVLGYFQERYPFDAFRLGATGFDSTWAVMARFDDEGLALTAIDENGVVNSEVKFDLTPLGLALATAALEVFPR